jgi:hypothetical protein
MKNDAKKFLLERSAWAKRVGKLPPGEVLPEVPGLLKRFPTEVSFCKEVDPETGMKDVNFVISTGALDRDHDVINQDGWELDDYRETPTVLYGHNYSGLPVAKAMTVDVVDGKLMATDRFTPKDIYPFGFMVYQMLQHEFLRATSVGFLPLEYMFNEEHNGYDFERQALLEHSIVPVPSNPEALMAASAKGIDLAPLREYAIKILDGDPDADTVALWLPKETALQIHRSLSDVAVSLTGSSTGSATTGSPGDDDGEAFSFGADLRGDADPGSDAIIFNNDISEAVMEEAIKALTEIVRTLTEALKTLPDQIADKVSAAVEEKLAAVTVKVPEGVGDDDSDDGDLTPDEIKTIIAAAVGEVRTAATGALPD